MQATAPASGKTVSLNINMKQCYIFDFVTKADLASVIEELETEKLTALWSGNFSKIVNDDGKTYLEAFKSRNTSRQGRSFTHFKSKFIRKLLGTSLRGTKLTNHIQSLPLEEQQDILQMCYPQNRILIKETFRDYAQIFGNDKFSLLEHTPTIEKFIAHLTDSIGEDTFNKDREQYEIFNLLVRFWVHGLILLPQCIRNWRVSNKWKIICETNTNVSITIKQIYNTPNKNGYADRCLNIIATFFATSSTTHKRDLSAELIYSYENLVVAQISEQYQNSESDVKAKQRLLGDTHKAALTLLEAFNIENPEGAIKLSSRSTIKEGSPARRDLNFGWLTQKAPSLADWANYFHLYLSTIKNARINVPLNALIHIANFLTSLENPPLKPWLIVRHIHITDVTLSHTNTFFEYLLKNVSAKSGKNILTTGRKFFLWLREYLVANGQIGESQFLDPILESDNVGKRIYSNRTHRDALPPFLIAEMKDIIVNDDFAFPRTFYRSSVQTIDQKTNYSVRVFYPGVSICMYTLLDTPIRSHQARWLDSGVLDEKVYNHTTGQSEYNQSQYAIPNRREGVLQLSTDTLRAESWLTMWVNTNKSVKDNSKEIGYNIPYVSPELTKLFNIQLEWSKHYLPELTKPLNYRYYMQDVREIRPEVALHGPEVAPLFRDPTHPGQQTPIAYSKLTRFYVFLLEETEKRIAAKHGHHLRLVTTDKNGKKIWAVDLHSLRVSGITNLIEAGVPIEVVQQFVAGHKTIVMTLHYLKYSPEKLRAFIAEAYRRMQDDQDFVGSQGFIQAISDFTPFLLSQSGAGTGPGFEALNMGDGIIVVNSDGICPGTSCSTGFVVKDGVSPTYGPVPGGKRCPLCRYWITGPAHLLGQITAVNNLGYSIRKKGLELRRLNELKVDAEDSGNQRLARELRDRIDLLNREVDLDVAEWAARYKYAEQSIDQMDAYLKAKYKVITTDATPRVPMITASAPLELKVTLESAHEFALLDQITQMAVFNPGFPNLQAELEKNQMLSKMMVANGMKPFLLSLSDEHAREAGNLLSALVLQQVNAQDLDEVLTGKKPLEDYPYLALAMSKLEQASNSGQVFFPNTLNAIYTLNDPSAPDTRPHVDQDNKDLFG